MDSLHSELFPADYDLDPTLDDPKDLTVSFHGIPTDISYAYFAPDGHNPRPHIIPETESSAATWAVSETPSGICSSFGIGSPQGDFGEPAAWIGSRSRYSPKTNGYLHSLDWILATSAWSSEEFRGLYHPASRCRLVQDLLGEGGQSYTTALRDHDGGLPNHSFALGVSVTVDDRERFFKIILPTFIIRGYTGLTHEKLARLLSFYGSGGTTFYNGNNNLTALQDSVHVPAPTFDVDVCPLTPGPVPLEPDTCDELDSSPAREPVSKSTRRTKFLDQVGSEVARTSATSFQLDHHSEPFVPVYAQQNLDLIQRLKGTERITSDDLIAVLESLTHQIGNTHNYNALGGSLRSDNQSRFGSYPAAQSQPGIEETGINDYSTAADTRRYGFDLGFMSEIMTQEFIIKKSSTTSTPCFLALTNKIARRLGNSAIMRSEESLRRKHFAVFSLAHRLDRMDKCKKYIDAWVVACGIDPRNDKTQFVNMMSIIPKAWHKAAETEVLGRKRPTMDRDQFKKEVAAKLQQNYTFGLEDERAHIVALSAELIFAQSKVTRDFFKSMFEELNSLPDNCTLAIEYYKNAESMINSYLLTDQVHDILYLDDTEVEDGESRDVLATRTAKKVVNKLRDMSANAKVQSMEFRGSTLGMVPQLKIIQDLVHCRTLRFAPSGQQQWLVSANGKLDPTSVTHDQVKMRDGSNISKREWSIILYSFIKFQDRFADLQTTFSETWEKAHLKKALKEDEKREAAYIFSDVQVSLGNRETICSYHYTLNGSVHKDIHCMYMPCYLHAWKSYEVSDPDNEDIHVTLKPGARVHLNGDCKLQQKYAKQLAESRHTFLYHDADLNVVSQDGRVFEPAVHVDRSTQDAAPGRNSRSGKVPTTFRRPRSGSHGSGSSQHSNSSKRSYMTNSQLKSAQSNRGGNRSRGRSRGSSRSRSSSKSSYYSSYSRFSTGNTSNGSTNRSRGGHRSNSGQRRGGSGRGGHRTRSKTPSYRQGSSHHGSSQSSHRGWHSSPRRTSNRYSKDWTSAQISGHAGRNKSPSRSSRRSPNRSGPSSHNHSPRRELRPRSGLRKPERYRSPSSGFRRPASPKPRRNSPGRQRSGSPGRKGSNTRRSSPRREERPKSRNPLICHNCAEDGHTSRDCRRPAHKCGSCNGHNHLSRFCMNKTRHTTNLADKRSNSRRY